MIQTDNVDRDIKNVEYLSISSISACARCPARFYWSRVRRLRRRGANRAALNFGKCHHAVAGFSYNDDPTVAYKQTLEKFREVYSEHQWAPDDKKRTLVAAARMIEDYSSMHSKHCPYKCLDVHSDLGKFAYQRKDDKEVPFFIMINGSRFPILGLIDRIVEWLATRRIWTLDYKTASYISSNFFDNFEAGLQACICTFAAQHLMKENVQGMIIEAWRVAEESVKKCEERTMLHHVYVQDQQIERALELVVETSKRVEAYLQSGLWPQWCTGCAPYGMFGTHGYQCDYLPLCDAADWRSMLSMYEVEEHSPFELVE